MATSVSGRSVNPISTKGADYACHSTASPSRFSDLATALYPRVNSSQPVLPYKWRNKFVSTTVHSIDMWFHSYTWNRFSTKFTWYYNMRLFMSINWLWVFKDLVTFITFYIRWIMLLFVMIPQFNYTFDQGNLIKSMDNKTIRRWVANKFSDTLNELLVVNCLISNFFVEIQDEN